MYIHVDIRPQYIAMYMYDVLRCTGLWIVALKTTEWAKLGRYDHKTLLLWFALWLCHVYSCISLGSRPSLFMCITCAF